MLSDFLFRQNIDDRSPLKIISISFNIRNVRHDRYYNIRSMRTEDKYLIQTRSQSKSSGLKLPEVHGVDKGINPHVQPEKQTMKPIIVSPEVKTPTWKKPRLRQCRAGLRRKVKVVTPSQPNRSAHVVLTQERQKSEVVAQPQASIGSISQTEHISLMQTTPKQPVNLKHSQDKSTIS